MNRIIENIYFLGNYLTNPDEPTKRREALERIHQFLNGERIHLSEDTKQCFINETIKLGEDDRA